MNDGWVVRPLGGLLQVQNGYAFDSKRFTSSVGIPLIRIRDLKDGTTTEACYDGPYDSRYLVRAGDLLVGMDGDFTCHEWRGPESLLNQRVCRLEDFGAELLPRFLYYGLNRHLKAIEEVTGFATVKHLSSRQILAIEFPVPPLAEQERIVRILDEALDGIATAQANTEASLDMARALFDAELVRAIGKPGDTWVARTLAEVAVDFGRGRSRHRPRNDPALYGGPYPFVQTGDVRSADRVITSYTASYNEAGLAQSKLWPKGTLCITIAANIAESALLGFDACFPDSVVGLVVDGHLATVEFLGYLITFHRKVLQAQGKGSAQDNINLATFEATRFLMPPLDEQVAIARQLDEVSTHVTELVDVLARRTTATDSLRQSILDRAFKGTL